MKHFQSQSFSNRVLVMANKELILASLLNYLYESGYDSIGVLQNDEAVHFLKEHDPHILIISHTIDNESRSYLKGYLKELKPDLKIIELEGGVQELKHILGRLNQ